MNTDFGATEMPQPAAAATACRRLSIGLPKCLTATDRRFPLTPEAVNALSERGFTVVMEEGAATCIHYSDEAYIRAGARIAPRRVTLECDIVIHLSPLEVADIRCLRRGAILLSMANFHRCDGPEVVRSLLNRHVINIAVDLIADQDGNHPFADILAEIAGRAAIVAAASMLADPVRNKGILVGGIAGVIPCEVVVLGSDIGAVAAARSAMGLGATVRMFDGDVYRLRCALRLLPGVIGSSIHPHALENALRMADIVVSTDLQGCPVVVMASGQEMMKRGVLVFDLSPEPGRAFPAMPQVSLTDTSALGRLPEGGRACFVDASSSVPRTAAMALGDTFITLLDEITSGREAASVINLTPGIQQATLTFLGKAVNQRVAKLAGARFTDIRILLTLS